MWSTLKHIISVILWRNMLGSFLEWIIKLYDCRKMWLSLLLYSTVQYVVYILQNNPLTTLLEGRQVIVGQLQKHLDETNLLLLSNSINWLEAQLWNRNCLDHSGTWPMLKNRDWECDPAETPRQSAAFNTVISFSVTWTSWELKEWFCGGFAPSWSEYSRIW